jgi:steroid delta-isomerase-like uncharacterized protein
MPGRAFPVVYSREVERSVGFYRRLGFEPHFRFQPDGEAGYVSLRRGDTDLGIVAAEWPEQRIGVEVGSKPRFELFVYVDDVDQTVGELRGAGVPVLREPEDMPWGERTAYVADPDGNPVTVAMAGLTAGQGIEQLVRRFYAEVWNRWDEAALDEVLDEDFTFRGSLGDEVRGRAGFRGYRDKIREAFPDFHNEIVDLVTDGERAAARLRYSGHHQGEVLDAPATGALVTYSGAAFFTAVGGRLREVWVLGDVDGLRRQLGAHGPT